MKIEEDDLGFFAPAAAPEELLETQELDGALSSEEETAGNLVEVTDDEEFEDSSFFELLLRGNSKAIYDSLKAGNAQKKIYLMDFRHSLPNLWSNYSEKSSVADTILIALLASLKLKYKELTQDPEKFTMLLESVLLGILSVDLDWQDRTWLLTFLIQLFAGLEIESMRNELMRLVKIGIWSRLEPYRLALELERAEERGTLWARWQKKLDKAKGIAKKKLELEASFLSAAIGSFFLLCNSNAALTDKHALAYAERFLEFLIDLEAQLPTRRFFHALFHDHLVLTVVKNSALYQHLSKDPSSLFPKLFTRLEFYAFFQIDEITGLALSKQQVGMRHHSLLAQVQKMGFVHFPQEMEDFIFASVGSLENPKSLEHHLEKLSDTTLVAFAKEVGARIHDVNSNKIMDRALLVRGVVDTLRKGPNQLDAINKEPLYPDE
ncbi:hypothetical protein HDU91_001395, partial [Kappamyces sp. JEL0680]